VERGAMPGMKDISKTANVLEKAEYYSSLAKKTFA
jgi:hypothetical protein